MKPTFIKLRDSRTGNTHIINANHIAYLSLGGGILLTEDTDSLTGSLSWEPDAAPKDISDAPIFSFYVYYKGRECDRFEYRNAEAGLEDLSQLLNVMTDATALPVWDLRFQESMVVVNRVNLRGFTVTRSHGSLRVRCTFDGFSHFFVGAEDADAEYAQHLLSTNDAPKLQYQVETTVVPPTIVEDSEEELFQNNLVV